MIITMSTPEDYYFKQLLVFLTSLKINSPNHKIIVFLINFEQYKKNLLDSYFKEVYFIERKVSRIDDRGIGLILFRIEIVRECIKKFMEPLTWIDSDSIVRKDISELLNVRPNQFKILFRGSHVPKKVRFNAGVFSVGCSSETDRFFSDWYFNLKKNLIWGMGQLELWNAYLANSNNINLVKMDRRFNDLGASDRECFFEDSVIWHCKKFHFYNEKYQKEFQYYFKKFNEEFSNGKQKI